MVESIKLLFGGEEDSHGPKDDVFSALVIVVVEIS